MNIVVLFLPSVRLVVCLHAHAIGPWLRVVDHPDGYRKFHSAQAPLVGALAVTAPFLLARAQWL